MAARTHTCSDCGQSWARRDARFCGRCGALLPTRHDARRRPRRITPVVLPALVVLVAVGLVTAIGSLERVMPGQDDDPRVRLDDDPTTTPSPLSRAEAQALRLQADPQRLRCEPRGCERWRLDATDLAGIDPASGVVGLHGDLVLLHARRMPAQTDDEGADHRIVAIDATTGQQRWQLTFVHDRPADWLRLLPGPQGALVLTGHSITSVDRLGAISWEWHLVGPDGAGLQVWHVVESDDVLLLDGHRTAAGDRQAFVAGLDPATGQLLWSRTGLAGAVLNEEVVVLTDDDGRLHRLDVATGEPLWDGPAGWPGRLVRDGDWLLARSDGRQLLVDVGSGRLLSSFVGGFDDDPTVVDDGLVGIAIVQHADAESTRMRLVHIRDDGSLGWLTDLGPQSPSWHCCPIEVDDTVTVSLPDADDQYDLGTGWLLRSDPRHEAAVSEGRLWRTWPATAPHAEISWRADGGSFVLRNDDAEVTISSRGGLDIASYDPLIVSDGRELVGVHLVGPDDARPSSALGGR